jgi:hypothetical protein
MASIDPITVKIRPRPSSMVRWLLVAVLAACGLNQGVDYVEELASPAAARVARDVAGLEAGVPVDRMIEQAIATCTPLGDGPYVIKETIDWPKTKQHCELVGTGRTRIVWAGEPGGTVINYCAGKGAMRGVAIDGMNKAAVGLRVESSRKLNTAKLTTHDCSIENCDRGVGVVAEPEDSHGDALTHFGLCFRNNKTNYHVDCDSSFNHIFYDVRCYGHYKKFFDFRRGGSLFVYGCYAGYSADATLLAIGNVTRHAWPYEIAGLRVDPPARRLTLVDCEDKHPGRIRISGSLPPAQNLPDGTAIKYLADEPLRGVGRDTIIDCTSYQWPQPEVN